MEVPPIYYVLPSTNITLGDLTSLKGVKFPWKNIEGPGYISEFDTPYEYELEVKMFKFQKASTNCRQTENPALNIATYEKDRALSQPQSTKDFLNLCDFSSDIPPITQYSPCFGDTSKNWEKNGDQIERPCNGDWIVDFGLPGDEIDYCNGAYNELSITGQDGTWCGFRDDATPRARFIVAETCESQKGASSLQCDYECVDAFTGKGEVALAAEEYIAPYCIEKPNNVNNVGLVTGIAIGLLILVGVVIASVVTLLYFKRRKRREGDTANDLYSDFAKHSSDRPVALINSALVQSRASLNMGDERQGSSRNTTFEVPYTIDRGEEMAALERESILMDKIEQARGVYSSVDEIYACDTTQVVAEQSDLITKEKDSDDGDTVAELYYSEVDSKVDNEADAGESLYNKMDQEQLSMQFGSNSCDALYYAHTNAAADETYNRLLPDAECKTANDEGTTYHSLQYSDTALSTQGRVHGHVYANQLDGTGNGVGYVNMEVQHVEDSAEEETVQYLKMSTTSETSSTQYFKETPADRRDLNLLNRNEAVRLTNGEAQKGDFTHYYSHLDDDKSHTLGIVEKNNAEEGIQYAEVEWKPTPPSKT